MSHHQIHYFSEYNEENDEIWKDIFDRKRRDRVVYANKKKRSKLCSTSCTSRHKQNPNREDYVWFPSVEYGREYGYQDCKRCRPSDPNYLNPNDRILEAKKFGKEQMAINGYPPSLRDVAKHLKMCDEYCHQSFKTHNFSWKTYCKTDLQKRKVEKENTIAVQTQENSVVGDNIHTNDSQIPIGNINSQFSSFYDQPQSETVSVINYESQMKLQLPLPLIRNNYIEPNSYDNTSLDIPLTMTTTTTVESLCELSTANFDIGELSTEYYFSSSKFYFDNESDNSVLTNTLSLTGSSQKPQSHFEEIVDL